MVASLNPVLPVLPVDLPSSNQLCLPNGATLMMHPGMSDAWAGVILLGVVMVVIWNAITPLHRQSLPQQGFPLVAVPLLGSWIQWLTRSPWPRVFLRLLTAGTFLWVIAAGLWGTPIPERNLATVLTWNWWWTLIIITILVVGTAWCAICPWDALAVWLTRRRLWQRGDGEESLGWRLPLPLRRVWPALLLLIGLTWLELGVGVTSSPAATATLAIVMVVLATVSLALFERKSFCRHICPVGRTLGCYAQLAPLALRPLHQETCDTCHTLECYHGSATIEPCPTSLTMGRFSQNIYCLSCGACVLSCPQQNVSWRLRPMASEARSGARPHWDEAWFMVALLGLTSFHGVTMMPFWEQAILTMAPMLGDGMQPLRSFTLGMTLFLLATTLCYLLAVSVVWRGSGIPFRRLFATLSFSCLPVAFGYHLAHNLNHLVRESSGFAQVWANPFGFGALPVTPLEKHVRMLDLLIPESALFALQAGLLLWGFWMGVRILRVRGIELGGRRLWPLVLFLAGCTTFNVWLQTQSMIMRL